MPTRMWLESALSLPRATEWWNTTRARRPHEAERPAGGFDAGPRWHASVRFWEAAESAHPPGMRCGALHSLAPDSAVHRCRPLARSTAGSGFGSRRAGRAQRGPAARPISSDRPDDAGAARVTQGLTPPQESGESLLLVNGCAADGRGCATCLPLGCREPPGHPLGDRLPAFRLVRARPAAIPV